MYLRAGFALLVGMVLVPVGGVSAMASECTQADRASGQCSSVVGSVGGDGVTITGTQVEPGSTGSSGNTRNVWNPPPKDPVLGSKNCEVKIAGLCRGTSPAKTPVAPVAPTPPQTLTDVVQFAPGAPGFVLEPAGWSLPLMPMNIFSTVREQTESGELLGWPIEVRFTPVYYSWSYGDGSTRQFSIPGSSWGSRQFSPTPTSHSYWRSGEYSISHSVGYRASYRFEGGGFIPLPGELVRASGSQTLKVLSVTPLLVERGCQSETLVAGRC
jgi:hypothetical protein